MFSRKWHPRLRFSRALLSSIATVIISVVIFCAYRLAERRAAIETLRRRGASVGVSEHRICFCGLNINGVGFDVYSIVLEDAVIDSQAQRALRVLTDAQRLWIYRSVFYDGGECIVGFSRLEDLVLTGSNIDDRVVRFVSGSRHLRILDVSNTGITNEGFRGFHPCRSMVRCDLAHTSIGDSAVSALASCPKIVYLGLEETEVTDDGIQSLESHPTLETVSFSGEQITDASIRSLAKCHALRWVLATGTAITPGQIERCRQSNEEIEILVEPASE